jgi:hypothetical protein
MRHPIEQVSHLFVVCPVRATRPRVGPVRAHRHDMHAQGFGGAQRRERPLFAVSGHPMGELALP